jgi:hypothetical protein
LRFKATLGIQFVRPYVEKNPITKRTGGMAQGVGPEFKCQYWKKKWGWVRMGCEKP